MTDQTKNIVLIILFVALIVFAAAFSIEDDITADDLDDLDVVYYIQAYFASNNTNPYTISIGTTNQYYNLTVWQPSSIYGLEFYLDGIKITKADTYRLSSSISFTGGNGGNYDFTLFINNVPKKVCGQGLTASGTNVGNMAFSCILDLNVDDYLTFRVKDAGNPAQDIQVYRANLNLVELE